LALNDREAAAALGVCRTTVRTLLSTGELPSFKIGATRRIALVDLERFIERRVAAEGARKNAALQTPQ
jgi:excisionase family DNA binding protein